jgi:hypothetical protein
MAADLKALLALRKRRTQRAQDRFAAAERIRQQAEAAVARGLLRFQELERSHHARRNQRVREVIARPTSAAQLVRIGLQYEIGEEEIALQAREVQRLRGEARAATEKVKEAHDELQACLKREKKLEEAVNRLSIQYMRIADVHAEMELER